MEILKYKGLDFDPSKITDSVVTKPVVGQIDTSFNESTSETDINMIFPRIEAIHAGRTANFNRYLAEKLKGDADLKSGVYSWTDPYPKPVIYNHDIYSDTTGRAYSASYSEYTAAGTPGIIVTPKITDQKAIKGVLEGRLLTVSIGASTNAAICSICSTDIIRDGYCGHMKGEEYDGQVAEWVAGDLWFDELSWVNLPADPKAMVTSVDANSGSQIVVSNGETTSESKKQAGSESIVLTADPIVVKNVGELSKKEEKVMESKEEVVEKTEEVTDVTPEEVITTEDPVAEEILAEGVNVEQLQTDLKDSQDKVEELENTNIALAKELNEAVAEILVDIRLSVGKESNKEEALEKYSTRTLESLKDSIADLLNDKVLQVEEAVEPETVEEPVARQVEKVEKPEGQKIVKESKTLATKEEQVISNEDALVALLSGKR